MRLLSYRTLCCLQLVLCLVCLYFTDVGSEVKWKILKKRKKRKSLIRSRDLSEGSESASEYYLASPFIPLDFLLQCCPSCSGATLRDLFGLFSSERPSFFLCVVCRVVPSLYISRQVSQTQNTKFQKKSPTIPSWAQNHRKTLSGMTI